MNREESKIQINSLEKGGSASENTECNVKQWL